ncbi:MAG: DUF1957 domain-containing protein, partial [Acidobacteria bacterium]|nr:DUF1957 domain-containing protein [Acidobacteriota bacterium]
GYPGNVVYREFYRDVGWDLPLDYIKPFLHANGERRNLGLKYYRITGKTQHKKPYIPELARLKAAEDAADFVNKRIDQMRGLRETFEGVTPLVVSPYDAELYGHWWFEGTQFLDFLFRELHVKLNEIEAITPGDFLDAGIPIQTQQPSASSWGENGYYKVWLNEENAWMYPFVHDIERRMTELANKFNNPNHTEQRILNQLARELLLAQSSDWAFQIYQGTTVEYSTRRFKSHVHRFNLLAEIIETGEYNEALLAEIEARDNIFREIDFRVYRSK